MMNRPLAGIGLFVILAGVGLASAPLDQQAPPIPRASAAPATAPQAEPRGAILGTVTDASTGQPVEGVRLQLSGSASRGSQTAYSDDEGRFAFANLGAGEVTLRGSKTGYVTVSYGQASPSAGRAGTPIELAEGQVIKDLEFSIPKGGVITGTIFDEKNRPSVGTPVRVMRWSLATGEPTLTSAGTATTDDRGIYRVYGLPPGEYIVSAVPRNQIAAQSELSIQLLADMERLEVLNGAVTYSYGTAGDTFVAIQRDATAGADSPEPPAAAEGYAPVYYPGTSALGSASTVTVGVSEEHRGINIGLARTVLVRVRGVVTIPPGLNISSIQLRLVDTSSQVPGASTPSARAGRDGTFTFTAVPPGQYRLSAVATLRSNSGAPRQIVEAGRVLEVMQATTTSRMWAMTDLVVSGTPIEGVTLTLRPPMSMSGQLLYDGSGPRPPAGGRVRVTLAPDGATASAMGASTLNATVEADGRFTVDGLLPVPYRLRTVSGVSGWRPKSALVGGRDVMDFPLDVQPDQTPPPMVVTLTDRSTEVAGHLYDQAGRLTPDYTVIVFPSDSRYWVPQSRRIRSTRPTTNGQFRFTGLPPGDYRLAAVTDAEPGQWYDPAFLKQLLGASAGVTLVEGQPRVQDLRIASGAAGGATPRWRGPLRPLVAVSLSEDPVRRGRRPR